MKVAFRQSFVRDLKKIKDRTVLRRIRDAVEKVEGAADLTEVPNITKLSGSSGYYRVRVGDYRIGAALIEDQLELVRCLPRRDIYRYFP